MWIWNMYIYIYIHIVIYIYRYIKIILYQYIIQICFCPFFLPSRCTGNHESTAQKTKKWHSWAPVWHLPRWWNKLFYSYRWIISKAKRLAEQLLGTKLLLLIMNISNLQCSNEVLFQWVVEGSILKLKPIDRKRGVQLTLAEYMEWLTLL